MTRFSVVEHGGIKIAPEHLAHAVSLLALRIGKFLLRDHLAGHLGNGIRIVRDTPVTVDAEKRKRRHDQDQQQKLHQALVRADEFKHGRSIPSLE